MKGNIGKLGMLLAVFLLVGSVFAGSVMAQPGNGKEDGLEKYKLTDSLYEWIDYYYNNPGKHSAEINGELLTIDVTTGGTKANIKIKYKNSEGNEIKNHLKIEKINDLTYKITEKDQSYMITPTSIGAGEAVTSSTPYQLSFSYYVGSSGQYGGSDSESQCLGIQKWTATGLTNTNTDTGRVDWNGPSVYMYRCAIPMGSSGVDVSVTDNKGFQLDHTSGMTD